MKIKYEGQRNILIDNKPVLEQDNWMLNSRINGVITFQRRYQLRRSVMPMDKMYVEIITNVLST